ncbi:MAG: formylmethanofuran dehydrogenase subunit E family protein [Deltaproteobacteria bacterium]|nr:formylmethanofuran dehydrogenase subunit E family protein [Deltaproteobacteria bacterium]
MENIQNTTTNIKETTICSLGFQQYLDQIKSFHGSAAPGIIIGGFMVDLAIKHLPKGILFDAISETKSCLPDAIQILTPCTIGNGWLKVLSIGRFAIILYEKTQGEGVRVYLDVDKIEPWSEIKGWFLKLKPKGQQDYKLLIEQIQNAGTSIMSLQKIRIKAHLLEKKQGKRIAICSRCKEAYPLGDGTICLACKGESPYDLYHDIESPAFFQGI